MTIPPTVKLLYTPSRLEFDYHPVLIDMLQWNLFRSRTTGAISVLRIWGIPASAISTLWVFLTQPTVFGGLKTLCLEEKPPDELFTIERPGTFMLTHPLANSMRDLETLSISLHTVSVHPRSLKRLHLVNLDLSMPSIPPEFDGFSFAQYRDLQTLAIRSTVAPETDFQWHRTPKTAFTNTRANIEPMVGRKRRRRVFMPWK